jgi:hypothetical protein
LKALGTPGVFIEALPPEVGETAPAFFVDTFYFKSAFISRNSYPNK